MHIAYLDEAGNSGLKLDDPEQPVHMIGAVLVPEDQITAIHDAADVIAHAAQRRMRLDRVPELHGSDLVAGRGPFKGKLVGDRLAVLEEVVKLPSTFGLELYFRGVDKVRLGARYAKPFHPHDIALMFAIEEIEARARRLADVDGIPTRRVLLVADEVRDRGDLIIRKVAEYQQLGTRWGYNTVGPLRHIVDTIHFVQSSTNRAVQVADCITWIALRRHRMHRPGDPIDPSTRLNMAIDQMWREHLESCTRANLVWTP